MKSIFNILVSVLLLATVAVSGQQDPNFILYRYNMNLINPAYAGSDGFTKIGLNVRSQWSNVQGAPETQSLIIAAPVGKSLGLGVSLIQDRTFIEKQTSLAADFSYQLKLSPKHDLYFGIKAGFNSYNVNTEGLLTYALQEDPSLMNISGGFNPDFGAGLLVQHESYFLSLSITKILNADRIREMDGIASSGENRNHIYFASGYHFKLSRNTMFKPTLLFRYVDAAPLSVDLTALVEFNKSFNIGAAYRIDESISGLVVFQISKAIQLGYAYEVALGNSIRGIDNGSHEILLNVRL